MNLINKEEQIAQKQERRSESKQRRSEAKRLKAEKRAESLRNVRTVKGGLTAVVAGCVAAVLLGSIAGIGSSQVVIRTLRGDDVFGGGDDSWLGSLGHTGPEIPVDLDRSLWRGVRPVRASNNRAEYSAADIFEMRSDTVVGIKLVRDTFGGGTSQSDIIGSGVVITADGFIVTNAHVIEGASEVIVIVDDYDNPSIRHEFTATVYGFDVPTDLAVLKIARDEPFRFSPVGRSSELRVGQSVVAIGNPVGLEKTMTKGIVSGLQRELGENPFMLPAIQTDAAVNPGNSGCPLFNMYGEIVGIVNIKLVSGGMLDNLGFAISIDEALPIIDDLARTGRVASRPMLGITAQPYSDGTYTGLEVMSVIPGSPAAESGLSRNDIITHIEGNEVRRVADVQAVLRDKDIGDMVVLTVVRYDNFGEANEIKIRFALISAGG
jgi:serine protease Do